MLRLGRTEEVKWVERKTNKKVFGVREKILNGIRTRR